MKEQLKIYFNKIQEVSNFSNRDIEIKKSYLNKFIENGFPNRKQENWKFLDINQIISNNISDLSFYNDYSIENKIDPSIFIDDLEHNKIIFKVPKTANKKNLKKNIEKIFKVNVTKINIINKQNRTKLSRGRKIKVSGFKKAIVTLKKGQNIDLTTGI